MTPPDLPGRADDATLHAVLCEATPADRTLHVLNLIADGETLRLPRLAGERLLLQNLRLDPVTLQAHLGDGAAKPGWWIAETGAVRLPDADCREANLQDADFSGADLARADFSDAMLRSARFAGATLEAATFDRADMSNADLRDAQAGEALFVGALLEDARFGKAVLRFARFDGALLEGADFTSADAWGARFDGAEAQEANFRGACLHEATLVDADCRGADFSAADLRKADLSGAKFCAANMQDAKLAGANLAGADLTEASLVRLNLSSCNLQHVRMDGAWLDATRFGIDQIGGMLGEEVAGEHAAARRAYLGLERNFRTLGDPEAASWAYRRARRMGKLEARAECRAAFLARDWRRAGSTLFAALSDGFSEWLCDYGESMPRVLRAYLVVLVCFAAFYGFSDALVDAHTGRASHGIGSLLSFSFLDMSTSVTPDIGLKPRTELVYFVGSLQYVIGVVLIGLFGYVLGNRIRR